MACGKCDACSSALRHTRDCAEAQSPEFHSETGGLGRLQRPHREIAAGCEDLHCPGFRGGPAFPGARGMEEVRVPERPEVGGEGVVE